MVVIGGAEVTVRVIGDDTQGVGRVGVEAVWGICWDAEDGAGLEGDFCIGCDAVAFS